MEAIMNIFDYAMEIEKEGENYYRDLAKRSENVGIIKIMSWLAEEEAKHYNIFRAMKKEEVPVLEETNLLKDAKQVFSNMSKDSTNLKDDISQPDLYRKARELEKKSIDLYIKKSEEIDVQDKKNIFLKIAEEEKKHYFLLDNIIEFVARPETWIENAEFNHLDEY